MGKETLSLTDTSRLLDAAQEALADLPTRRVAIMAWGGVKYRAVRAFRGIQVQSSDRRRLIAERQRAESNTVSMDTTHAR